MWAITRIEKKLHKTDTNQKLKSSKFELNITWIFFHKNVCICFFMNTLAATCENNNNKKVKKNCHAIGGTDNTFYTTPYIMTFAKELLKPKVYQDCCNIQIMLHIFTKSLFHS